MHYVELKTTYPTGKKDYRCSWCGQKINKGEKHLYRAYVYDGFTTDRMHLECEKAMTKLDPYDYEDGWSPGQFERGSTVDKQL